jgi:hypothetical protein
MPELVLTYNGANGIAHSWAHVQTPLDEIKAWANSTGLDYSNIQTNGLHVENTRAYAGVLAGRIKVRNNTGSTLNANDLVSFQGTYSDGTDNYPLVVKAVSTEASATTFFAQAVVDSAITTGSDGTVCLTKEVGSLNTLGLTAGRPIFLGSTAGSYSSSLLVPAYRCQIVGFVSVVSATIGRIIFGNWSIIPYDNADQI